MKTYKVIIFLVCTVAFFGCLDDLEPAPPNFISDELFFSNPGSFETGLNGVYDALQSNGIFGRMPILLDGVSDNGLAHFPSVNDIQNFGNGSITPDVANIIEDAYQGPYVVIQRANGLLVNMEGADKGTLSQKKFDNIMSQARVLRALAYKRLVYLFGGVPLYTTPLGIKSSIEIPRSSREDVIAFIHTELSEAAQQLDSEPLDGVAGRVTKQAALALYAQTMVFEARLGNVTWADARAVVANAKSTAEGAGAGLVTEGDSTDGLANYNAVFNENNEENEELLFYIRYDFGLDNGPDLQEIFSAVAGKQYMSAHTNLADDFYTTDGLPITDPSSIFDIDNPYANRDPRLHSTLVIPGDLYADGSDSLAVFEGRKTAGGFLTDFLIRKFTTLNNDVELNRGGLDIPVIRYAELLLLFAEAENQVSGPTPEAYNAINALRTRVNVAGVTTGLTKAVFNNEVIHERRVELAFEGKRWFDLVTLGIANDVINNINEQGRSFTPDKQELFPIPRAEVDRNPNLEQNPGY